MIFTLLIALFILFTIFQRSDDDRLPFFQRYKKLIISGSIALSTIVLLNVFRPTVYTSDLNEIIENSDENGLEFSARRARELKSKSDPTNIPKLFEYVRDCVDYYSYDESYIQSESFSIIPELQRLALAYADALAKDVNFETAYRTEKNGELNPNYPNKLLPYHNFVIAQQQFSDGNFNAAIASYEREIKVNPSYSESYVSLYELLKFNDPNKFHAFIVKWSNAQHLDKKWLENDYYVHGDFGLYFSTIYLRTFFDMNIMAFIAGLIISIIWMIFLRKLDFFDKEKWSNLILVFIGGVFFANICLFFYDFAFFNLGWTINGSAWNDFWYCVCVIGGSEELVKCAPWILFALLSKRLTEPYDYIIYASVAALGFALTENLNYLEESQNIVVRFIMSTMMHMFTASIVAYCMVLAKYKYKTDRAKMLAPFIGFGLACFAHGFYDFWLISPSAEGLGLITTIFFLLTVHLWFYIINNATNHSTFFDKKRFEINDKIEFLGISILGIILLQYVFLSIEFGANSANYGLQSGTILIIGFLLYVAFVLAQFRAVRGKWIRYAFPFRSLIGTYIELPFSGNSQSSSGEHVQLNLRLFCPKDNAYLGAIFPASGVCERTIRINGKEDWYLFRLNQSLGIHGFRTHEVVLKPKSSERELTEEKIEIYVMLIPTDIDLLARDIPIKYLKYTGRCYSIPI